LSPGADDGKVLSASEARKLEKKGKLKPKGEKKGKIVKMKAKAGKTAKVAALKKTKKAEKKAVAKKAEKKTTEKKEHGPNKTQIGAMQILAKSKGAMTRSEIAAKMDGAFIGGKVMGHAAEEKRTESSLVGRGLVKFAHGVGGENETAVHYELTAKGKKFLEELKKSK